MSRELDYDVADKVMTHPHANWRDPVPSYSTDIEAAWSVVEHLTAQGAYVLVEGPANGLVHSGWRCQVTPHRDLSAETEAWGDTAMLAICRAALAAVGQEVVR